MISADTRQVDLTRIHLYINRYFSQIAYYVNKQITEEKFTNNSTSQYDSLILSNAYKYCQILSYLSRFEDGNKLKEKYNFDNIKTVLGKRGINIDDLMSIFGFVDSNLNASMINRFEIGIESIMGDNYNSDKFKGMWYDPIYPVLWTVDIDARNVIIKETIVPNYTLVSKGDTLQIVSNKVAGLQEFVTEEITGSDTLTPEDKGKHFSSISDSDIIVTINAGLTNPISIFQKGLGRVTILGGIGVTLIGNTRTAGQNETIAIFPENTNVYQLAGGVE